MSYSCLVVVGNGQGTAGIGMGKDITPGNALYKATRTARNSLIIDRFDDRTLFHAINDRYAKTKLVIRLRQPGSGTRCAWHVWKMLSAISVSDVSVKIHSSRNPTTVAYALFNALQQQSTARDVADQRGVRVLDMDPREIRTLAIDPHRVVRGATRCGRRSGWADLQTCARPAACRASH